MHGLHFCFKLFSVSKLKLFQAFLCCSIKDMFSINSLFNTNVYCSKKLITSIALTEYLVKYVSKKIGTFYFFLIKILKYGHFPLIDKSLLSLPLRNLTISNWSGLNLSKKVIGTPITPS